MGGRILCYHDSMMLLTVLLLLLQGAQATAIQDIPSAPGVYYRQPAQSWINIPKAPILSSKLMGTGLFVETGGYTNLGTDVVCEGDKAKTRISDPMPTLFVKGIGPAEDVQIVRLTKKKAGRAFYKSSANSTIENKIGARKSDLRMVTVTRIEEGVIAVTPDSKLDAGEYLLVIGEPDNSYDFGIDAKR